MIFKFIYLIQISIRTTWLEDTSWKVQPWGVSAPWTDPPPGSLPGNALPSQEVVTAGISDSAGVVPLLELRTK